MTDQAALGPDGQLLDTSKIAWFNDPDDPKPIQPCTTATPSTSSVQGAVITFLLTTKRKQTADGAQPDADTDIEDKDFGDSLTESGSNGSDDGLDSDDLEIGNEELADMLPSKTIPEVNNQKGRMLKSKTKLRPTAGPARKKARISSDDDIEEVEANKKCPGHHFSGKLIPSCAFHKVLAF
ncbi:hypothetical protein DFH94DRAFT_678468 [Russula ochroleuca]|uniref:Uncharacterized protein n=1 Tax=Russula ochroleuca TaxID=152965 RepID=A0A9P5JTG5_9AGAM|nr:hypothetical protein DFH94DRAFT_687199 [Russula ochroleuca]KAF8487445.1 hypothetical protein DFH94DRAFT_678468 [Russula ochroleuca]